MILDRVTPEAWGEVVDKAIEQARVGDARARERLASFLVAESLKQVEKWKKEAHAFDASFEALRIKTTAIGQNGEE